MVTSILSKFLTPKISPLLSSPPMPILTFSFPVHALLWRSRPNVTPSGFPGRFGHSYLSPQHFIHAILKRQKCRKKWWMFSPWISANSICVFGKTGSLQSSQFWLSGCSQVWVCCGCPRHIVENVIKSHTDSNNRSRHFMNHLKVSAECFVKVYNNHK